VFFLGGGDQSRLVSCLVEKDGRDTPLLAAIRRAHVRGAVVAGTSAGAAGQAAAVMITGGDSEAARRDGAREGRPRGDDLTFRRGGLGFFPFGIPDTHFSQRERQDRLIRLAADTGTRRAFGIDENTALIVERPLGQRPTMRALGHGQVTVYDLSRTRRANGAGWPVRGVRTRILGDGDRLNLSRR
jgi:cyanophycinase